MTRIWSNTEMKNNSRPPSLPLINFTQRWKMLDASEFIASNETQKGRKAQGTINVLKKNLFCYNLVHSVLSVWLCKANKSRQVQSLFIFLNDRQNHYNFCHISKVEDYALFSGSFFLRIQNSSCHWLWKSFLQSKQKYKAGTNNIQG